MEDRLCLLSSLVKYRRNKTYKNDQIKNKANMVVLNNWLTWSILKWYVYEKGNFNLLGRFFVYGLIVWYAVCHLSASENERSLT